MAWPVEFEHLPLDLRRGGCIISHFSRSGLRMSHLIRWLRRWQQRDDQHLVKRADPIEELRQIVGEAQDRDAVD